MVQLRSIGPPRCYAEAGYSTRAARHLATEHKIDIPPKIDKATVVREIANTDSRMSASWTWALRVQLGLSHRRSWHD